MQFPKNNWATILKPELNSKSCQDLFQTVEDLYQTQHIVPSKSNVFKAFELTDFDKVKVVILAQDPYPNPKDAMGLAFSIPSSQPLPKSLVNIFKELNTDLHQPLKTSGDLTSWATQGVLLLNTILTTVATKRDAHKKLGWQENLTIPAIKALNSRKEPIVFILWGNPAQSYAKYITDPKHLILEASHPSPLGVYRSFWDSKPFSKTNNFLESINKPPIKW